MKHKIVLYIFTLCLITQGFLTTSCSKHQKEEVLPESHVQQIGEENDQEAALEDNEESKIQNLEKKIKNKETLTSHEYDYLQKCFAKKYHGYEYAKKSLGLHWSQYWQHGRWKYTVASDLTSVNGLVWTTVTKGLLGYLVIHYLPGSINQDIASGMNCTAGG